MKNNIYYLAIVILTTVCIGCSSTSISKTPLNQSGDYYNYIQPNFDRYLQETNTWLRNNRQYISSNHDKELDMNMPFEIIPKTATNKAILFVHGLGDSPYSFSDLANSMGEQGFRVQTLMLPGHGSKPEDMMQPSYFDWQAIVDHYANLLKNEYDEVWLGGFSTGANLVTIHAIERGNIQGLLLFSPGFQSQ
ncbi:MAG: alpha/beta fold hydrolase, partial [Algicola sp.]|nr:alpha/beta fold hydrolase [Algicola sp.]